MSCKLVQINELARRFWPFIWAVMQLRDQTLYIHGVCDVLFGFASIFGLAPNCRHVIAQL